MPFIKMTFSYADKVKGTTCNLLTDEKDPDVFIRLSSTGVIVYHAVHQRLFVYPLPA